MTVSLRSSGPQHLDGEVGLGGEKREVTHRKGEFRGDGGEVKRHPPKTYLFNSLPVKG